MSEEDDENIIRKLREKGRIECFSLAEWHSGRPVRRIAKKRKCAACSAPLSQYNGNRYCAACRKKMGGGK